MAGVVHVGVPLVVEFKDPAAGFDGGGVFGPPVSAETDLPVHEPLRARGQSRVIAGQTRFVQGDDDDGGVPNRGGARLEADAVGGLVLQLLQFLRATPDEGMIVRITEGLEGDAGIKNAGKNRGQAIAALEALDHPLLGLFQGELAERMDFQGGEMFGKFVELVQPDEEIAPGKPVGIAGQHQIALVQARREKLVQRDAVGQGVGGLEMVDDGQGTSMERLHELMS